MAMGSMLFSFLRRFDCARGAVFPGVYGCLAQRVAGCLEGAAAVEAGAVPARLRQGLLWDEVPVADDGGHREVDVAAIVDGEVGVPALGADDGFLVAGEVMVDVGASACAAEGRGAGRGGFHGVLRVEVDLDLLVVDRVDFGAHGFYAAQVQMSGDLAIIVTGEIAAIKGEGCVSQDLGVFLDGGVGAGA